MRGGRRLYALSSGSAETWPHAEGRFAFLRWFAGLVISGLEGLKKPDPAIYELLLSRHEIVASRALFIDDVAANVEASRCRGLQAIPFRDPPPVRRGLAGCGLPVSRT